MNVKLLRKVKKHILEEPKRLQMGSYIRVKGKMPLDRPWPKCGTAGCIAGWACILSAKKGTDPYELYTDTAVGAEAQELLGITFYERHRLFEPIFWPMQFTAGLADDGKAKTAKVAAARIEHFIKTEGRE